jgi:polysaccharide export outer membrane protein
VAAAALVICGLIVGACAQRPRSDAPAAEARPAPQAVRPDGGAAAPGDPAGAGGGQAAAHPLEYRLGPGDALKISVYNNPDLSLETEVARAGTISFPLIGEVALAGLTRAEAERTIAERLRAGGFVPRAHVNVYVAQYRSRQVSVLGEVNKPGVYQLSQPTSLTDIIAAAGGITPKGSSVVTVIRRGPNGAAERYRVDVKHVFAAADMSRNFEVASEDIVYVEPHAVFYIYGEVRQPGVYPLTPGMRVQQALSVGGGLTMRGTDRGIRIDRQGSDGQIRRLRGQLNDQLQANDVLTVPESWF